MSKIKSNVNKTVKRINAKDLLNSKWHEGLVLRSCDGDPLEWIDFINSEFEKIGIFLDSSRFNVDNCVVFDYDDITCILFEFVNVKIEITNLSIWRIYSRQIFFGTWLSDYIANTFNINYDKVCKKYILPTNDTLVYDKSMADKFYSWMNSKRNNCSKN